MLINELSKRTGVSIHTIRFYENKGLIQGLTDENVKTNNYKDYDENAVERIEIIKEAKEVGFTLSEIKKMLENWFGNVPRKEQIKLFTAKIDEIDKKIIQLKQVKKRLEKARKQLERGEC